MCLLTSLHDHPTPPYIFSTTFFLATGLTALSFIMEKKEGLLDRSLVAGESRFNSYE